MAPTADPLSRLLVLELLEVGPVQLEPDRLRMPCSVTDREGQVESTELVGMELASPSVPELPSEDLKGLPLDALYQRRY